MAVAQIALLLAALDGCGLIAAVHNIPGKGPTAGKSFEWIFKPKKREVIHQFDSVTWGVGYIESSGHFVPNKYVGPAFDREKKYPEWKHLPVYNAQHGIRSPLVYEYRSGTLIPGVLAGSFLPIASEKAITLSTAPRKSGNNDLKRPTVRGFRTWP